MEEKSFNLVTNSWLQVIDKDGQEATISLDQLFANAGTYRQLGGEMKSQDLAILRFLLSILTTVYSRYDFAGQPYEWLETDEPTMQVRSIDGSKNQIEDSLRQTWRQLYQSGHFTEKVSEYLHQNLAKFDLFDKKTPFYQVTRDQYDSFVPSNKSVAKGKGTVAVKQLNRTISESNNKPDIFSPNTPLHKNDISLDALARWLITYQNFTAVTDKTKIVSKGKFSVSKGWLYGLNPVFLAGKNLFDILVLNLVLIPQNIKITPELFDQKPVWETPINEYVQWRKDEEFPENLAQLYTVWSRIIHIEWDGNKPIIFSAGLPKLDNEEAMLETMTTWKKGKKDEGYHPDLRWLSSLGKAMWRNFGQYVPIADPHASRRIPGIVQWTRLLRSRHLIPRDFPVHLMTTGLINDGNATSQSPAAEFFDEMQINADVLFDDDQTTSREWTIKIEKTVELTEKVGSYIWSLAKNEGDLRKIADSGAFANQISARFYDRLNRPFNEWLSGLTNEDKPTEKIDEWKSALRQIAFSTAGELLNTATSSERRGKVDKDGNLKNIFINYRIFKGAVWKITGGK